VRCDYFDAGRCRSCELMGVPYDEQLSAMQDRLARVLADVVPAVAWQQPAHGPESGFRNKAKLVVGGVRGAPTLGILDGDRRGVDLRHCGLYEPGLHEAVVALADLVAELDLTPYDVPRRAGELKHVLVTHSPDDELMIRFVLRSRAQLGKLKAGLRVLHGRVPQARVVTANLLPGHRAVLEGDEEIWLSRERDLPMRVGGLTLHLRPRSFFQTNTAVAEQLYRQAGDWLTGLEVDTAWDLYCGVGGFALAAAGALPRARVTGVEVSADAVRSARRSAEELGVEDRVGFVAADAATYVAAAKPADLVVVNPPRRGIGPGLAGALERSSTRHVLYSSCDAASLARDLAALPSFEVIRARGFAMFPQTEHHEVLVLAGRR
jgi:23S rRNA (uracil747-C5)-methyltransferase